MTFDPSFLDEIRARVPLAQVIGRQVRLARRGREFTGLCPFHKEKSPSFTVNEDKGFFHCFGCGAHGDVIGFVMRQESLGFPEAVERLAQEANLPLPKPAGRKAAESRPLLDVLEAAADWYQAQLGLAAGAAARAYLARRGLTEETIGRWRLGAAPEDGQALRRALKAKGFTDPALLEAGLIGAPEGGGEPFGRFRGRVMFPIGDARGRVIGFGARALGEAQPKYLNSPETALFHKGHALYGLAEAKGPARAHGQVILVEGYMDVITLHQAGISTAVAPLGTALTEHQLTLLWRLAAEPVVCLDGDPAGRRAAARAAARALPWLAPGRSLQFAFLPAGEDPDSLVRGRGAAALQAVIAEAAPLIEMLWLAETEGQALDTPERQAALGARLEAHAATIRDATVREHYRRAFADLMERRVLPQRRRPFVPGARGDGRRAAVKPVASRELRANPLGRGRQGSSEPLERAILGELVRSPPLLGEFAGELAPLRFGHAGWERVRTALLERATAARGLDSPALRRQLSECGLDGEVRKLVLPRPVPEGEAEAVGEAATLDRARSSLREMLDRYRDRTMAERPGGA